jgi:hypothetical protein
MFSVNNLEYLTKCQKFFIVFGVKMSASIAKDRALVRLFGSVKEACLPLPSYLYWSVRDIFTVTFAFIAPSSITSYSEKGFGVDKNKTETTVTFFCPILL